MTETTSDGTISHCMDLLKQGDHDAAQLLRQRYIHRLVELALARLRGTPRRADECRRLLDQLGDETLRRVAVWKVETLTNAKVAERLGCVASTVGRKPKLIREPWDVEVAT
jgi:hypothetical protein